MPTTKISWWWSGRKPRLGLLEGWQGLDCAQPCDDASGTAAGSSTIRLSRGNPYGQRQQQTPAGSSQLAELPPQGTGRAMLAQRLEEGKLEQDGIARPLLEALVNRGEGAPQ